MGQTCDIVDLADHCRRMRDAGLRLVLCHGCFDFLHFGHLRHFKAAKEHGDVLLVTVTPDRYVDKGPDRPVFPEEYRVEFIAALEVVDYVALNQWPTAVETIERLRPAVFAKGGEYKNPAPGMKTNIPVEEHAVRRVGGKMVFTGDVAFASTSLLARYCGEHFLSAPAKGKPIATS